jgi:microsomal dipeptidase-like Zn-dependent dipeptidase
VRAIGSDLVRRSACYRIYCQGSRQGRNQTVAAVAHGTFRIACDGADAAHWQISQDHARAIAETGGAIGIWHFFPSLEKYVDGLKEMVDVVGVDHVCIGTDQQVAPGIVQDYSKWVHLVGAMLTSGFTPEEAGKIAGGNYMRIFRTVVG